MRFKLIAEAATTVEACNYRLNQWAKELIASEICLVRSVKLGREENNYSNSMRLNDGLILRNYIS